MTVYVTLCVPQNENKNRDHEFEREQKGHRGRRTWGRVWGAEREERDGATTLHFQN